MYQILNRSYVTALNRFRELRDDASERGLTTTEIAVLTFVLVAAAFAIGALLYSYAEGRVEDLPEDTREDVINSGESE